jgi:hypothetical protein
MARNLNGLEMLQSRSILFVAAILLLSFLTMRQQALASSNITKVYVQNNCREVLNVSIEHIPVGRSQFVTSKYIFSPGEIGYLVDTDNLYVYITATSRDSTRNTPRRKLNVGSKPGKFTYTLTC